VKPGGFGATLAGALLTAGLVAGSRVPWVAAPDDRAVVRIDWRAVGERSEECREPTAEEQAGIPAHMRQSRICEGRVLPFRLAVRVDGDPRADERLEASGAQGDRPIIVFRDLELPPGEHRLEIRFEVEHPPGAGPSAGPALRLDATVQLLPRQILLVTRAADDAGGGLQIVARPDR